MAVRSGKIIADASFVVDRIQTNLPGPLNIPTEKIYDMGGYASISTVRDVPEISFDMWDTSLPRNYRAIAINRDVVPL